jgi:putative ABC transport system permease protein
MSTAIFLPALRPMVSSLLRHRLMPLLLLGQIVLACAILTNVAFLLQRQLAPMLMSDGIVRNELLLVDQLLLQSGRWTTALGQTGKRALQAIPGVRAVAPTMGLPMRQTMTFTMPVKSPAGVAVVPTGFAGDGLLQALGLELVQGRDFNDDDYAAAGGLHVKPPTGVVPVILSEALAQRLFPDGDALGGRLGGNEGADDKSQYIVIGIVRHLLRYELGELDDGHAEDALLYPSRNLDNRPIMSYAVRTDPTQRGAVKQAIPGVIQHEFGPRLMRDIPVVVKTYEDQRRDGFKQRRAAAWLLGSVCAVVTAITLIGIASLSGYWIEQRTRQIGIRRALGASRTQILLHFQVENLLLTSAGLILGLPLAYAVNQWLMLHYELPRLPLTYLPLGALLLWMLGQASVLGPARRAAAIAPAIATRSA